MKMCRCKEAIAPFHFGDVVVAREASFVSVQQSEVIYLPDTGSDAALSFQMAQRTSGPYPFERATSDWRSIKRIGGHELLPKNVRLFLEPYRRGVVVNGSHWDTGVCLFPVEEKGMIEAIVQGDSSQLDKVGLGSQDLLARFFGDSPEQWRVLVHRNDDWATWEMFGPCAHETEASHVFAECVEESQRNPPMLLRRGVYANTGQINAVVLYRGTRESRYWSYLVGQGENEAGSGVRP
mgnify:CR=1 FL=1